MSEGQVHWHVSGHYLHPLFSSAERNDDIGYSRKKNCHFNVELQMLNSYMGTANCQGGRKLDLPENVENTFAYSSTFSSDTESKHTRLLAEVIINYCLNVFSTFLTNFLHAQVFIPS